jgi:DNA primase
MYYMQLNNVFKDWLNRCKITDKVLEDFQITTGSNFSLNGECITIPIFDIDGNFSFNKYRRSPLDSAKPKYVYDKGGKVTLYGWHKAKVSPTILITEGEKDSLVAWSYNIPSVTSTGGALSFQKEWGPLFIDKEVIVCLDNDSAGGEGMVKILSIIPHAKMLFLPANIKDIAEYTERGGDLNDLIKNAKYLPSIEAVKEDRVNRLAEFRPVFFHDAYLAEHEKPVKEARKDRITTDRLLRAKEYPIDELLDFKQGKTCCLWHNEKTPSLHYFKKSNSVYCFGMCGKARDSIDVYRQLHNCSFNEAVSALQ